jgi:RNA polymerase sigma factor (sigma-70 family)
MTMAGDIELLREYAASGSEAAFATLVSRHINLVHAVARRHAGNAQHAEEITQAVFIILAKKAGTLKTGTVLSGWLFHTARLTAANFVRTEMRRTAREQEAYMQSTLQETGGGEAWRKIAPLLDQAVAELGEKDRNAVVLRFIEGKELAEVGTALGASEAAAQKRVNRAVEKLRKFFTKRGVMLSGAILTSAIAANAAPVVPIEMATSVAGIAAMKGAAAGASTLSLMHGTLKLMAWAKIKMVACVGAALLLAVGGGMAVSVYGPRTAAEIARLARDKYSSLTSYRDTGTILSRSGNTINGRETFETVLDRAGHYRVSESQQFTTNNGTNWTEPVEQACWFAGDGHYTFNEGKPWKNPGNIPTGSMFFIGGTPVGVPLSFFRPDNYLLRVLAPPDKVTRGKDEKIGDVACYVLNGNDAEGNITLCIGKNDFLIHQIRQTQPGRMMPDGQQVQGPDHVRIETHENISINGPVTLADFAFTPAETGLTVEGIVKKVEDKYASLSSYRDMGIRITFSISPDGTGFRQQQTFSNRVARPKLYQFESRLEETNYLKPRGQTNVTPHPVAGGLAAWSAGEGSFEMNWARNGTNKVRSTNIKTDDWRLAVGFLEIVGTQPAILFFAGDRQTNYDRNIFHGGKLARGPDEKIAGIDCYVLTNALPEDKIEGPDDDQTIVWIDHNQTIIWVGKEDNLIHQIRWARTSSPVGATKQGPPDMTTTETHENISVNEAVKPEDFACLVPEGTVFKEAPKQGEAPAGPDGGR